MPKSFRFIILLAGFALLFLGMPKAGVAQDSTSRLSPEELALNRYGGKLKKVVEAQDAYWKEYLKGGKVYYLDVYNAGSRIVGRNFFFYILLAPAAGSPCFIESSEDAVAYIEQVARIKPKTAQELMQMFARLKRTQLLNKPTDLANPLATEQEIVPPVFNKVGQEKHVQFYVLDDPETTTVVKCDLFISPGGKIRCQEKEVSSRAAYQ